MALVVLDASVVIGYLTHDEAHHVAAAAALAAHAEDDLRLPSTAYAEVLIGPIRKGWLERARAELRALLVGIEAVDEHVAERAADLRARFPGLRLPDALIVAYGEVVGADAILTTDRRWRRVSARVRVIR